MSDRHLGAFRVLEPIGKGGMGEVFLAEDTRLGRRVAIKCLGRERQGDEASKARLLREARTASALNHPHICTLFDVGSDDGQMFIVMEYVAGKVLSELIPSGGLPAAAVVAFGTAIAQALAHAHERGVVHRDLKSSNVMIKADGTLKVLDFGLATFSAAAAESATLEWEALTRTGTLLGTPLYMSPEQLKASAVDWRTDIWSLGVVLYEAASGRVPFSGRTAFELSSAILRDPAPPLPPAAPAALGRVIRRCLAKEPARRYQQAGEVVAALEALGSAPAAALADSTARPARPRPPSSSSSASTIWHIDSLAVLPLANLTGDPEQEYLSDGMTEALINDLARIGALKVISRTSVMRYKGSELTLPEIAGELGVDGILEGSVLRVGDRVRITAQLVHVATDSHLWAESYTAAFEEILELQGEVARAVAGEIRVKVTPEERARLETPEAVKPEAYEAYLKARHYRNAITAESFEKAIGWAGKALALDPGYARPHALLAEIYVLRGMYGFERPRLVFPLAKERAAAALALDDGLAEAHSTMAWAVQVLDFDREASDREYRRALELDPNHDNTLMRYGSYLIGLGSGDEGLAHLRRTIDLDPRSPIMNAIYAYGLYLTRRYDEAIQHCRGMLGWEPGFWWTYWDLGEAYAAKGLRREAVEQLETAAAQGRNAFTLGSLGAAYARAGDADKARAILAQLEAGAGERYVPPYFTAIVHLGLGDRERALEHLERAFEERDSWISFAQVNPALDELRSEPRFQALVERMGLVERRGDQA